MRWGKRSRCGKYEMLRTYCAELRCKSSSRNFWKCSRIFLAKQESLSGVRGKREGMLACLAPSPQLVVTRCQFAVLRDVLSAVNAPYTTRKSSRSPRRVNVYYSHRNSRALELNSRLDEHAKLFGTTSTGIKLPTDSALGRGSLSDSYTKVLFTTRAMAEAGEEAVPLIVVYVTVPNKETAMSLATSLVTNKLAACVNQVPGVVSTYLWEGKVETDEEILLIIKTRRALLDSLTAHVKSNHPYTVPEVIALPILGGSDSYVKWVVDNTQKVVDMPPADLRDIQALSQELQHDNDQIEAEEIKGQWIYSNCAVHGGSCAFRSSDGNRTKEQSWKRISVESFPNQEVPCPLLDAEMRN